MVRSTRFHGLATLADCPTADVDDVDNEVSQLAGEVRREIVSATLEQDEVRSVLRAQRLHLCQVTADVLPRDSGGVNSYANRNECIVLVHSRQKYKVFHLMRS